MGGREYHGARRPLEALECARRRPMAVLPIVRMGNPVLRTPAAPVPPEALAEPATQQWIDDLIETMYDAEGEEGGGGGIPLAVLVNPALEPLAGEPHFDWEGCLSIPDLRGLVPRHP